MLCKTRGIVLHAVPYNDKYSITHIYTEVFGRASFLVARARGKKSTVSKAMFMPLSVLDMEVEHRNNRELHRVREAKPCYTQTEILCNPVKNVLALFLAEVLFRVVRNTEPDRHLFDYLYDSIRFLEVAETGVANFHLVFMLRLLHHLGIYPNVDTYSSSDCYFDMLGGVFVDRVPTHRHYLTREESDFLARLLKMSFENMSLYSFSRKDRVAVVERIIEYYRLHLPEFPEIKSLSVMQGLFD